MLSGQGYWDWATAPGVPEALGAFGEAALLGLCCWHIVVLCFAKWVWPRWSWRCSAWLGVVTCPYWDKHLRWLFSEEAATRAKIEGLCMFCRHGREGCLGIEMRGGEKYYLRRRCFPLFHCPPSKSYDSSDQVLFKLTLSDRWVVGWWLWAVTGSLDLRCWDGWRNRPYKSLQSI